MRVLKLQEGLYQFLIYFFANDSLLFAKVIIRATSSLWNIIKLYEKASRQVVKFQKAALCFSPNVGVKLAQNIQAVFGVEKVTHHSKYLGLSSSIYRNKNNIFKPICGKVNGVVAC